jgi:hypothetical protein
MAEVCLPSRLERTSLSRGSRLRDRSRETRSRQNSSLHAERALEVSFSLPLSSCPSRSITLPCPSSCVIMQRVVSPLGSEHLAEQGMIENHNALSRVESTKLFCFVSVPPRQPRTAIEVIARPSHGVIDRTIQCHGAIGLSQDTSLAHFLTWARDPSVG